MSGHDQARDRNGLLNGRKIIVADDIAVFRRALVRQLGFLGMEVRGAGSLEELEQYLSEYSPNAVLLDWHFGGQTAEDVLESLRARWIPAIVLTGDPEGVKIPGVPILGKPVELGLLRHHLVEVLTDSPRESSM